MPELYEKEISKFAKQVYKLTKKIPKGKIVTYKCIAVALGMPKACQAVGGALAKNPYAPIVPCHRVIKTDGSIGGFFGKTKGSLIDKKLKLLKSEGITFKDGYVKNFDDILHKF